MPPTRIPRFAAVRKKTLPIPRSTRSTHASDYALLPPVQASICFRSITAAPRLLAQTDVFAEREISAAVSIQERGCRVLQRRLVYARYRALLIVNPHAWHDCHQANRPPTLFALESTLPCNSDWESGVERNTAQPRDSSTSNCTPYRTIPVKFYLCFAARLRLAAELLCARCPLMRLLTRPAAYATPWILLYHAGGVTPFTMDSSSVYGGYSENIGSSGGVPASKSCVQERAVPV
ncbi:unnamed protein product [Rangifer tarandus platyrhynchus]|uniref:Uncharacterized protein n=1 Tax=Rangifer tarandus platyrhynchus TaxID=3082113 RepID=A0ABN8XK02_RANTA|nr:unnamed protein product [Rangifer tarandus platyrhynchus]